MRACHPEIVDRAHIDDYRSANLDPRAFFGALRIVRNGVTWSSLQAEFWQLGQGIHTALSSGVKAQFASGDMRLDSENALLNLSRMVNSSERKIVALLQSKIFVDDAGEFDFYACPIKEQGNFVHKTSGETN